MASPRTVGMVGLLALLPVLVYIATQPDGIFATVAAVNVAVIVGSLVVALSPVESPAHV